MHTQNETMAAGTAFAISYEVRTYSLDTYKVLPLMLSKSQSDIKKVTPANLAVFSIHSQLRLSPLTLLFTSSCLNVDSPARFSTPFKMVTQYSVPAALPACPVGGCICAWGWVPNACGQSNIYHQAFRCNVTGATSTVAVAAPKAPEWCEDDASKCVKGAKQMVYWQQLDGNNIALQGTQRDGGWKSPGYNSKLGFVDGACMSL